MNFRRIIYKNNFIKYFKKMSSEVTVTWNPPNKIEDLFAKTAG